MGFKKKKKKKSLKFPLWMYEVGEGKECRDGGGRGVARGYKIAGVKAREVKS